MGADSAEWIVRIGRGAGCAGGRDGKGDVLRERSDMAGVGERGLHGALHVGLVVVLEERGTGADQRLEGFVAEE